MTFTEATAEMQVFIDNYPLNKVRWVVACLKSGHGLDSKDLSWMHYQGVTPIGTFAVSLLEDLGLDNNYFPPSAQDTAREYFIEIDRILRETPNE